MQRATLLCCLALFLVLSPGVLANEQHTKACAEAWETARKRVSKAREQTDPSETLSFVMRDRPPLTDDMSTPRQRTVIGNLVGDTAIISITYFTQWRTVHETVEEMRAQRAAGAKRFVIDLENTPGGSPWVAIAIAYHFSRNPLAIMGEIQYFDGRTAVLNLSTPYPSWKFAKSAFPSHVPLGEMGEFADIPIAVWVNGDTASASETLTGILKGWGYPVFGSQKTHGKGAIQRYMEHGPLSCRVASVVLEAEYFWGPLRERVQGVGIAPTEVSTARTDAEKASFVQQYFSARPMPKFGELY